MGTSLNPCLAHEPGNYKSIGYLLLHACFEFLAQCQFGAGVLIPLYRGEANLKTLNTIN